MATVRYESARPCRALQPFIARFWEVRSDGPVPESPGRWSLPDGGTEWLFILADPLRRGPVRCSAGGYAAGVATSAFLSKPCGRVLMFGIAFVPGGASAFLRAPAEALAGRIERLEELWGASAGTFAERLHAAAGFRARVELAQAELLRRARPLPPDVTSAIASLRSEPGRPINSLAPGEAEARRLERGFSAHVGVSAKRLARIFRFRSAASLRLEGGATDWADLAAAAGYADQAHLVREFNELAGSAPGRLWRDERKLSDLFNRAAEAP